MFIIKCVGGELEFKIFEKRVLRMKVEFGCVGCFNFCLFLFELNMVLLGRVWWFIVEDDVFRILVFFYDLMFVK